MSLFKHRGRRFGHSIFGKLILILVAAGIAINILVGAGASLFSRDENTLKNLAHRNLGRYAGHLIDDLGTPPRLERGLEMQRELGLDVRTAGPQGSWATREGLPADAEVRRKSVPAGPGLRVGHGHGRGFALVERDGQSYTFFATVSGWWSRRPAFLAVLLFALSIVTVGAFFAVRRLIWPIKPLHRGVHEIAAGNLDYRVPVSSRDEFGELAAAFNQMAGRVQHMVKSKEQLLLDVSHELRSPLTRMRVAATFVSDEKRRAQIEGDLAIMESMLADLLESARLDSPHGALRREPIDLALLTAESAVRFADRPPGVMAGSNAPLPVVADAERIRRVLENLLDNACKYAARSGRPVEIASGRAGERAFVTVRDHGPGIPLAELALVFEPFYRIDKSRSQETAGYGLGLSLSRKIMTAHGGNLTLAPAPGGGTIARLELPAET